MVLRTCPSCQINIESSNQARHLRAVHQWTTEQLADYRNAQKDEAAAASGRKVFKCQNCASVFRSQTGYQYHLQSSHDEIPKRKKAIEGRSQGPHFDHSPRLDHQLEDTESFSKVLSLLIRAY